MNRLYKNLLNLLLQKIRLYNEFIDLLRKEWDAVAGYSLENFTDIMNKKETLILKSEALEENRNRVMEALAKGLGLPAGDFTLNKLISSRQDPCNPKLAECRRRLLKQIETIRELNEKNKLLINHSSLSLKKSMAFIHRCDEESRSSYYSNGRLQEARMQSRLLNTDA